MSQQSNSDEFLFWYERIRRGSGDGDQARPSALAPADADSLEQLLWEFAEGTISDDDFERLGNLAVTSSDVRQKLANIHAAIEATASSPHGDAEAVWARQNISAGVANSNTLGIADLVIGLLKHGIELFHTSGSPAYVPALARGKSTTTSTTIQFLKSIGTIHVTVDHVNDQQCNLGVVLTRVSPRYEGKEFVLEVRVAGQRVQRVPFESGEARVRDLTPATYDLLLLVDRRIEATIVLDVKPARQTNQGQREQDT